MARNTSRDLATLGTAIMRVKAELERRDLDLDTRAKLKRELKIPRGMRLEILDNPDWTLPGQ